MHASADHRIVVLHGKESFLRSEHTRRVLACLHERFGAVDEFSFDGASCSLADVLDELRSYGLMSQHKVVVVDNAEQFMQGDDRRRAMERYAESPMQDATLILRSAGWRPGTFDKLVAAVGVILKCEAPGAAEAVRWAVARSQKRHGVELSAAGAQALVERVGPDLGRLDSELGKLAVGALATAQSLGQGSNSENTAHVVITPELVKEFTGLSREEQAWEIQGALATGDPAQALNKVTEDAMKEQQAQQEAQTPEAAMAPGAIASLAGAAQPQSPIPGVGPGMASLGDLLGSLRRPAMTISPMRGVSRGAV